MCTNEINILINDIKQIATDYLKYFKTDRKKTLEDTTYYVYEILYNIYDKKIIKKYMYIEILEQLICNLFPYLNDIYKFKLTESSINKQIKRVLELKKKPQPEQRTKEWYDFRNNRFGASEIASIFNSICRNLLMTLGLHSVWLAKSRTY